jgi:saccharopine dehydrogenase-like NADP-dependent oxidoreductase
VEVAGLEKRLEIKSAIASKYSIQPESPAMNALEWLGLFSDQPVHLEKGSPFDVISDLMIKKMMLGKSERDMVIMQHIFTVRKSNGELEKIKSSLLDFGDSNYTSIAKTVALPAAIGVKMILDGKIDITGVHIPIKKEIYEPILDELEKLGLKMKEEYGLPA